MDAERLRGRRKEGEAWTLPHAYHLLKHDTVGKHLATDKKGVSVTPPSRLPPSLAGPLGRGSGLQEASLGDAASLSQAGSSPPRAYSRTHECLIDHWDTRGKVAAFRARNFQGGLAPQKQG